MRFLSVCSGIEAATVAWQGLIEPWAYAEVDTFPSAVLAHHYPQTPNLGDITKFQEWPDATIDILVGGTPCQSFSVAGLRAGLDDPRGSLMLTYLAIARRYRPRWVVWENVPGVLSSDRGRAFGTFLGGLAEVGYGFAYRVLDAQYFGLAQRRARVFVVGHLGDWRRAAAVLIERESLSGHPAPCRETGQVAPIVPGRRTGGCGLTVAYGGNNTSGPIDVATVAFQESQSGFRETNAHPTLDSHNGSRRHHGVMAGMSVRRLTPRECERLQGFPDDYTLIPYRGKLAADGPRYKALGNSMAVPVMRWIGRRLIAVDRLPALGYSAPEGSDCAL